MFTKAEKEKLQEMYEHFEKIEAIYLSFSPETQETITEYHNETGSIPHCYRWGLNGTEELLNEK